MWLVGTSSVSGNLPFRLDPGEYLVGRSPKADILVEAPAVSRRHARLVCQTESITVEDLRSRHGTFVNDEPAAPSTAHVGARLRFGSVLCLLVPVAMYPAQSHGCDGLTPAQHEVLHLVLEGLDEPTIAQRLDRSGHTVHTHVKALFKRFAVHSRAELLAKLLAGKKSGRLP
jgi:pSer/pThr/pTyr-binding forkhead associated (FHA) protein